jgi:uncharacterized protein Yka (UPF0111/DUF47 family)
MRRARPDPELLSLFEESGRNVQRACLLLRDLLSDYPEQSALAREILLCEQEGDRIVHDILHRLAARGSKRAHLDSADVHALAGALDDIVDYAEECADQLGLYGVEAPMEQSQLIAGVLVGAAEHVATGLRGLRNGLFVAGIDPMMVIRWKDIFETLEAAVDACETVANVLEGMTLKRANRH